MGHHTPTAPSLLNWEFNFCIFRTGERWVPLCPYLQAIGQHGYITDKWWFSPSYFSGYSEFFWKLIGTAHCRHPFEILTTRTLGFTILLGLSHEVWEDLAMALCVDSVTGLSSQESSFAMFEAEKGTETVWKTSLSARYYYAVQMNFYRYFTIEWWQSLFCVIVDLGFPIK